MEISPRPEMNCPNCFYYHQTSDVYGECRRYAPSPNSTFFMVKGAVGDIKVDIHWPKVYSHSWCGEFHSRNTIV